MKHLIVLVASLLLIVVSSFGQTQLTRLVTIAGDSTVQNQYRSVEYLPSGVIWMQGATAPNSGLNFVYRSTDNGATWVKRTVYNNPAQNGSSAIGICNIAAKDENTAIIGLITGELLRTTNGGVKWDTVYSYSLGVGFFDGVRFVGQDTVVAYGDADAQGVCVVRSTDAGKTWTRNMSLPGDSVKLDGLYAGYATYGQAMEVYGRTIWITLYNTAGDPPSILKSTDGGTTWSWFRVTLPGGALYNYYIRSITFKDNNTGYAVGRQVTSSSTTANYLVKTTDGGKTWSDTLSIEGTKSHSDTRITTARAIRGSNIVIAVGYGTTGAKAWQSNDNGTTWTVLSAPTPSTSADFRNLAFGPAGQGLLVGLQNVVKITLASAVKRVGYEIPDGYALNQNYPNPFNPTTTISYALPKASFVELKVYDMLGRTVATLVNGEQTSGSYNVVFDAKGLSSGVYLYSIKAGSYTATKSLVLVK